MNYYCDVCDKTINIKSNRKHLESITHNELEECIRRKHTMGSPYFFDIDSIFNNCITNHNQKVVMYLAKQDFKSVFVGEFYPQIKSELRII